MLAIDMGGYDPLLGKTNSEIAALSRSQHKSQGFGSAAAMGERMEYLKLVKGKKLTRNDPLMVLIPMDKSKRWGSNRKSH